MWLLLWITTGGAIQVDIVDPPAAGISDLSCRRQMVNKYMTMNGGESSFQRLTWFVDEPWVACRVFVKFAVWQPHSTQLVVGCLFVVHIGGLLWPVPLASRYISFNSWTHQDIKSEGKKKRVSSHTTVKNDPLLIVNALSTLESSLCMWMKYVKLSALPQKRLPEAFGTRIQEYSPWGSTWARSFYLPPNSLICECWRVSVVWGDDTFFICRLTFWYLGWVFYFILFLIANA